jgi:hypothetical protein
MDAGRPTFGMHLDMENHENRCPMMSLKENLDGFLVATPFFRFSRFLHGHFLVNDRISTGLCDSVQGSTSFSATIFHAKLWTSQSWETSPTVRQ